MDNKTIQMSMLKLLFELHKDNKMDTASENFIIEKLSLSPNECQHNLYYLIEKGYLRLQNYTNGFFTDTYYVITANGMDIVTSESCFNDKSGTTIHQVFKGEVGNVSGRDFIINNVTTNIYLNALKEVIEKTDDISDFDKKNLIQKIKELKDDPMIRNLSTVAITEAVKHLLH